MITVTFCIDAGKLRSFTQLFTLTTQRFCRSLSTDKTEFELLFGVELCVVIIVDVGKYDRFSDE